MNIKLRLVRKYDGKEFYSYHLTFRDFPSNGQIAKILAVERLTQTSTNETIELDLTTEKGMQHFENDYVTEFAIDEEKATKDIKDAFRLAEVSHYSCVVDDIIYLLKNAYSYWR